MASITTRVDGSGQSGVTVKGAPLTNSEIDQNFLSLNNNKLETSWTGNTSIVTLGTVATGTWNATTIGTSKGGTGLTSFTANGAVYATSTSALTTGTLPINAGGTGLSSTPSNGQIDIGNGSGFTRTTLTGTTNQIIVTNSAGAITISTPQDLASSSNVQHGSIGIGTAASGTAGEIRATNAITAYYSSDRRLKENITNIKNPLEKVQVLNGVTYDWTDEFIKKHGGEDGYFIRKQDLGLIAQDVEKVMPEIVAENNEGYLAIKYERVVALLVEAVKELKTQLDSLKKNNG